MQPSFKMLSLRGVGSLDVAGCVSGFSQVVLP